MIPRCLTFTAMVTLSAAAAAADPAQVLGNVAAQMTSEARTVATLLDTAQAGKPVTRQFSRADGVYFFVLMPGFKDQVTVDAVMDVDAFADTTFQRLDVSLPRLPKIDHFQGFRAHQYRDGVTGITYALLIPVDRTTEVAARNRSQAVRTADFCGSLMAPDPPQAFPANENSFYIEGYALADSNGIWHEINWKFESTRCPSAGCNPNSPTGYTWTTDHSCSAQDPQPAAPPSPPTPSPPATGSMGGLGGLLWGVIPVIIAGNAGMGWTFACNYGGQPIPCASP